MPIYDQTFRRYEGPRRTTLLWWPITRQTMRAMLKMRLTWVLLAAVVIPVVVISVIFLASAKITQMAPDKVDAAAAAAEVMEVPLFGKSRTLNTVFYRFLQGESAFIWLLVLATGGGIINTDKRNSALPLYFSRPLRIRDYMAGKILGLTLFPAAALLVAIVVLYLQAVAYFYTLAEAYQQMPLLLGTFVYILMLCPMTALSMVALSAVTPNPRTAGVCFIGFWFATGATAGGLYEATRLKVLAAISPMRSMEVIGAFLMQPAERDLRRDHHYVDFGLGYAVLSVALYALVFLLIFRRSLKVVEVVK